MKRRNTPTKQAILDVLEQSGRAMSHDAIESKIAIDIDRATIYRILNQFCEDGLVHKVVAEDGKQYFAMHSSHAGHDLSENHMHFRCTVCHSIECLPEKIKFQIPEGYSIEKINCIASGQCSNCSNE